MVLVSSQIVNAQDANDVEIEKTTDGFKNYLQVGIQFHSSILFMVLVNRYYLKLYYKY